MSNKELLEVVSDFTTGLLKHAKIKHAGNCLTMSQILRYYLAIFYKVPTELATTWVKTVTEEVKEGWVFADYIPDLVKKYGSASYKIGVLTTKNPPKGKRVTVKTLRKQKK